MRLKTFGSAALEGSAFRRPKALVLLAFLAAEGARERRYLRELFFPRVKDASLSLRVMVSQIRAACPDALLKEGSRLRLGLPSDVADLTEAFLTAPERVPGLYQGAFLEGMTPEDWSEELAEWVLTTREALARQVRASLLQAAERHWTQGDGGAAGRLARRARRLPGAPPLDVDELQRLYTLSVAMGDELGGLLREEARELDLTLRGPLPAPPPPPEQGPPAPPLPPFTTSFVGREGELQDLRTLLEDPAVRLLTLVGTGGQGKTRLALELARRQPGRAMAYVPLENVQSGEHLPLAIAQALRVPLSPGQRPLDQLRQWIGPQPFLLILDNFEQLRPADSGLTELLETCPGLKVLVTSRERLELEHEALYPLSGLGLEGAETSEAAQLFVQRARRANARFRPGPDTWPSILEICRQLDASPLGIELAAAWVRSLPVQQIAAELAQGLELLEGQEERRGKRQRLRVIFEQAWSRLSADERELLSGLSIFCGGFTRAAAAAVLGATLRPLVALVDAAFLRLSPAGRYTQHPLLQHYVRQKLQEEPTRQAQLERQHAEYFQGQASVAWWNYYTGNDQRRWAAWRKEEYDNVEAAIASAERPGLIETALDLCRSQSSEWVNRGLMREGGELLGALLERTENHGTAAYRHGLLTACELHLNLGSWSEQAEQQLEDTLRLAREAGDAPCLSEALSLRGILRALSGDLDAADGSFREALGVAREGRWVYGEAKLHANLAVVALHRTRPFEARDLLGQALHLATTHGLESVEAGQSIIYAETLLATGEYAAAEAVCERAHTLFSGLHRQNDLGVIARLRGLAAFFRSPPGQARRGGDLDRAEEQFRLSDRLLEKGYMGRSIDVLAPGPGDILWARGDLAGAERHFRRQLEAGEQDQQNVVIMNAHFGLGRVAQDQDEPALALHHFQAMLGRTANAQPQCLGLEAVGVSLSRLGDPQAAARLWGAVAQFREEHQLPRQPIYQEAYLAELGRVRRQLGEADFTRLFRAGEQGGWTQALEEAVAWPDRAGALTL